MDQTIALAAAATLVSLAFALSTLDRWMSRRKRHEAAWTVSLFMFSAASASLWAGASLGWGEWTFKSFYLFGAILNVAFLALGTVYLLGGTRLGDRVATVTALAGAFAAGLVVATPLRQDLAGQILPEGSEVFGPAVRAAAAIGSGLGALVIFGGAAWSAWRLLRTSRRPGPSPTSGPPPRRLAMANALIATGVLVLARSGASEEIGQFSVLLVAGISTIFAGFLMTQTATPDRSRAWYPPRAVLERITSGPSAAPFR